MTGSMADRARRNGSLVGGNVQNMGHSNMSPTSWISLQKDAHHLSNWGALSSERVSNVPRWAQQKRVFHRQGVFLVIQGNAQRNTVLLMLGSHG